MIVWVLFVFMSSGIPMASAYEVQSDCERAAAIYKKATCVKVVVPK